MHGSEEQEDNQGDDGGHRGSSDQLRQVGVTWRRPVHSISFGKIERKQASPRRFAHWVKKLLSAPENNQIISSLDMVPRKQSTSPPSTITRAQTLFHRLLEVKYSGVREQV